MIGMGTTIFLVNPVNFGGTPFANDYSLLFDGVDEYVSLSNTPSALVSSTSFSVSCWIKATSLNDAVLGFYTSTTDAPFRLFLTSTDYLQFGVRNGANSVCRDNTIFTGLKNTWVHVVCVYDGGGATDNDKAKLYVNGSLRTVNFPASSFPTSTSATSSHTYENIGWNGAATYWSGNIDEAAIFDYSLTSGQVTSLYNSGTPTDLDNTSGVTAPVHWWRMGDGDTFSTITDVGTTGGNNGTMTNMEAGDIVSDTP